MAVELEELVVKLIADTDKYRKEMLLATQQTNVNLDKIQKDLVKTGAAATGFSSKVSTAMATMAGYVGGQLVLSAISSMKQALAEAGGEMLSFSEAIAEVNSILPLNGKLTEAAKDKLIDFSSQFGGTPTQQAKAFYQIVSAGITDTTKAVNLLKVANVGAVAGVTDVKTAIEGLTSALAVYEENGLTATEASDILFASVREGKTTFGELSNNMGAITAVAKSAGLEFDELSGTLAFLTKSGLSTERATTGLRGAIASILKPSKEAKDAAEQLGIELSVAGIKHAGSFAKFMEEVRVKTNGSTDAIAKLFPNVESLPAILNIVNGNFADFVRIQNSVEKSAGASAEAFKELEKSSDFQLETLEQSLKNILLYAGEVADSDLADFFKDLRESIPDVVDTIGDLATALDVTVRSFQTLWGVVQGGDVVIKTVFLPLTALIWGTDSAIEGVKATLKAAKENFFAFGDAGDGVLSKISEKMGKLGERAKEADAEFKGLSLKEEILSGQIDKVREKLSELEYNAASMANTMVGVPASMKTEIAKTKDELSALQGQFQAAANERVESEKAAASAAKKSKEETISGYVEITEEMKRQAEEGKTLSQELILSMVEENELRNEVLDQRYEDDLDKLNQALDQKKISLQQYLVAVAQLEDKHFKSQIKNQKMATSQLLGIKDEETKGVMSMLGALATFQNAKSKEMAFVGKAAASFNAGIAAYEGAIKAAAAVASIPFVGPGLAVAAYGSFLAMGLSNVAKINGIGFNTGGRVPGVDTLNDSVYARLRPTEEVLDTSLSKMLREYLSMNGMQGNVSSMNMMQSSQSRGVSGVIRIELVGSASDMIRAQFIQDDYLGISDVG